MGRRVLVVHEDHPDARDMFAPYCSTIGHPVGRVMDSRAEAYAFCVFFDACAKRARIDGVDILGPNTLTSDDAWRAFCQKFGLRFVGDDDRPIYDDDLFDRHYGEDDEEFPSKYDEWSELIQREVPHWDYRSEFAIRKVAP